MLNNFITEKNVSAVRNRGKTYQKKAMSNSRIGTTINYSDCIPNNGDETLSFVCLFNVLYQLQLLHNDQCYMTELVKTTDRGECTRTKKKNCLNSFFLPVMEITKKCRMWSGGTVINYCGLWLDYGRTNCSKPRS